MRWSWEQLVVAIHVYVKGTLWSGHALLLDAVMPLNACLFDVDLKDMASVVPAGAASHVRQVVVGGEHRGRDMP